MVGLAPKWVRLAPNGTNPGLFQIRFQCIWRGAPKALKYDMKSPGFVPFAANLTHFGAKPTIPEYYTSYSIHSVVGRFDSNMARWSPNGKNGIFNFWFHRQNNLKTELKVLDLSNLVSISRKWRSNLISLFITQSSCFLRIRKAHI